MSENALQIMDDFCIPPTKRSIEHDISTLQERISDVSNPEDRFKPLYDICKGIGEVYLKLPLLSLVIDLPIFSEVLSYFELPAYDAAAEHYASFIFAAAGYSDRAVEVIPIPTVLDLSRRLLLRLGDIYESKSDDIDIDNPSSKGRTEKESSTQRVLTCDLLEKALSNCFSGLGKMAENAPAALSGAIPLVIQAIEFRPLLPSSVLDSLVYLLNCLAQPSNGLFSPEQWSLLPSAIHVAQSPEYGHSMRFNALSTIFFFTKGESTNVETLYGHQGLSHCLESLLNPETHPELLSVLLEVLAPIFLVDYLRKDLEARGVVLLLSALVEPLLDGIRGEWTFRGLIRLCSLLSPLFRSNEAMWLEYDMHSKIMKLASSPPGGNDQVQIAAVSLLLEIPNTKARLLESMHSFQQRIVEPQDDTDRRTAFAKLHLLLRSMGLLPDAPEILMALPVFQEILNYLRHPNPDFQTMCYVMGILSRVSYSPLCNQSRISIADLMDAASRLLCQVGDVCKAPEYDSTAYDAKTALATHEERGEMDARGEVFPSLPLVDGCSYCLQTLSNLAINGMGPQLGLHGVSSIVQGFIDHKPPLPLLITIAASKLLCALTSTYNSGSHIKHFWSLLPTAVQLLRLQDDVSSLPQAKCSNYALCTVINFTLDRPKAVYHCDGAVEGLKRFLDRNAVPALLELAIHSLNAMVDSRSIRQSIQADHDIIPLLLPLLDHDWDPMHNVLDLVCRLLGLLFYRSQALSLEQDIPSKMLEIACSPLKTDMAREEAGRAVHLCIRHLPESTLMTLVYSSNFLTWFFDQIQEFQIYSEGPLAELMAKMIDLGHRLGSLQQDSYNDHEPTSSYNPIYGMMVASIENFVSSEDGSVREDSYESFIRIFTDYPAAGTLAFQEYIHYRR